MRLPLLVNMQMNVQFGVRCFVGGITSAIFAEYGLKPLLPIAVPKHRLIPVNVTKS